DVFGEGIDYKKVRNILKKKNNNLDADLILQYADNIIEARELVKNLEISVIKLYNHTLDEVIDIFSNINTKGSRLTNFDLIHAKWSNLNDSSDDSKFDFEKNLKERLNNFDYGYEKIDKEVFVDSLYLNFKNAKGEPIYSSEDKINYKINIEDSEILIKRFYESLDAFEKTYKFLKGMNMAHKFLPSKIIFKWLSYFFAKTKNKTLYGVESDIIKNYIKLASINDRYRSSSIEMLKKDIEFVKTVLLSNNIKEEWEIWKSKTKKTYFDREELQTNILDNIKYSTSSMISNYIKFILHSTTRSFFKGASHANDVTTDMHHIFPRNCSIIKSKSNEYKELVENIANTTPLSSDENKTIGNKNPSQYLVELHKKAVNGLNVILNEHGIEENYLENDDFEKFIVARSEFIIKKVNDSFKF
ncbi:MAG: GmrSD restriction endonuclease domain-containing protein, partial [Metamycoplasmataceae bacterium]